MSFGARITVRALRDISDARDWYDEQVSGLGQEFGVELERVLGHVCDEPLIRPCIGMVAVR